MAEAAGPRGALRPCPDRLQPRRRRTTPVGLHFSGRGAKLRAEPAAAVQVSHCIRPALLSGANRPRSNAGQAGRPHSGDACSGNARTGSWKRDLGGSRGGDYIARAAEGHGVYERPAVKPPREEGGSSRALGGGGSALPPRDRPTTVHGPAPAALASRVRHRLLCDQTARGLRPLAGDGSHALPAPPLRDAPARGLRDARQTSGGGRRVAKWRSSGRMSRGERRLPSPCLKASFAL